MPSASPPQQQWPRGPSNGLHTAVFRGSTESLVALLSDGSIDIDQGDPKGNTPLMIASYHGHSHAVRILLNKGANVSIVADDGFTALHYSAQEGHLAISKMLVEAGADLEAATSNNSTPLHLAAEKGHSEVMRVLIEAGANHDSRCLNGATPLYFAAQNGHMGAVKMLLRAKANPLLATTDPESGETCVPFGIAAQQGHLEVVRELVQQVGIEGCGGASEGVEALRVAAGKQHVDIMAVMTDAGVVDNGEALVTATAHAREASIKFLLQQRKGDGHAYVNYRNSFGGTPLMCAMGFSYFSPSPTRIARLLVDAGADATSTVRFTTYGEVEFNGAPLDFATSMLREKKIAGKDATEEQLHKLEGIRRLLLRVEAVHAVSFLWQIDTPSMIGSAAAEGTSRKVTASTPLRMMLPILRRRARRPRVLLAALFRNAQKEP